MSRAQRSTPPFAACCFAEPGPYQAPVFATVPALRSSMKNAAPRPGHETVQSGIQFPCPTPDSPWLRHHRQRWLRHDAHLWIRPDAARFFPPGTDPAVINPTLPRKPDAAKAAAFEAEIEAEVAAGYRLLAVLREEVAELRAELKRRRELEAKYSPSQPRVPAGNPRGGQWSNRNEGGAGFGSFGTPDGGAAKARRRRRHRQFRQLARRSYFRAGKFTAIGRRRHARLRRSARGFRQAFAWPHRDARNHGARGGGPRQCVSFRKHVV